MSRNGLTLVAINLLLLACVTPEVLDPRDGTVPAGVDLSGNWRIQSNQRADQARLRDAIRRTDGVKDDDIFKAPERQSTTQNRRGSQGRVRGGLVYVFLETGSALKITQTPDGLFISFDRSVVEEFRFGENRIINVGEVEAQRVTGWVGDQLVVDTLDRNSMKLTDSYQVIGNSRVLERIITLRSKAGDTETIVQLFDRQD